MRTKAKAIPSLIAAAIVAFASTSSAYAVETKYEITVNWSFGQLAGTSSHGWLSFDSSLATPNASYTQPDILSGFGFSLRGREYGLNDVRVGAMAFDSNAELHALSVGTDCVPGACYANAWTGNTNTFYVLYDSENTSAPLFGIAVDAPLVVSGGAGSLQLAAVPEPSTIALMLSGIALIGVASNRRRGIR